MGNIRINMKKRVNFPREKQLKLFRDLKELSKLSWKELSDYLNVNTRTLCVSYKYGYCKIPENVFNKLCKIIGKSREDILEEYLGEIVDEWHAIGRKVFGERRKYLGEMQITYKSKDTYLDTSQVNFSKYDLERGIRLPNKLTPELAEEVGMHFGDGFISSKRYDYRLKGNPKDEKKYYTNYIKQLFKKLYNVDLNLKESWKSFGFELRSKAIWEFKTKVLEIKPGKKYGITIPEVLKVNDKKILAAFLRGLFDTDGSLCFKTQYGYEKYYPTIALVLTSKKVIKEVALILGMFGLEPRVYYNDTYGKIYLNGINRFKRYSEFIGWSTQKNLDKIRNWEKRYPELNQ
tara:strand:+ start:902 stop:1942 length:1041 start_codon:yes stop_codon:yes gene_type:complete